jgi:hypothetical protein
MAKRKVEANAMARVNHTLRLTAGSMAVLRISLKEESRNIPASGAMMKRSTSEASMAKIQLKSVWPFIALITVVPRQPGIF